MIGRVIGQIAASLLAVAVMGGLAGAQSVKPSADDKLTINGWALSMSNVAPGANQSIQIQINGWSSPAQRQHLIETFLATKQEGLVRELEKQPEIGRFNFPDTWDPIRTA